MYDVIIRSDSVKANPFRKCVTSDVLPAIRKTGGYIVTKEEDTPEIIMARAVLLAQASIDRLKTMNEIKIFNNPQFGEVRTIATETKEPLFCLADLCRILDLRQGDVRQRLSDDVVSTHPTPDSLGRLQ